LYTAYPIAAILMTSGVFEGHCPLQAFSSAIFHICGASRGPSASAEFLVLYMTVAHGTVRITVAWTKRV